MSQARRDRSLSFGSQAAAYERGRPSYPPEAIDWLHAVTLLGLAPLDATGVEATLGSVLKYREDADRVRDRLDVLMAS